MPANLIAQFRHLLGGALLLIGAPAFADWGALNMPQGVTPISQQVYDIHMLIFWICVAIGVVVFGAMVFSIVKHRKSLGVVPAQFHESTKIELLWTIVPFIILIAMAIPATKVLVAMEDTSQSEMTVKITGYQWKWRYDYIDEDVGFFSSLATPREQVYNAAEKNENYLLEVDNPLVLPVDTKVRLLTTAADVIHAWWVPDLGWKRDAIPGIINDNWTMITEPGTYRGMCTELCGKDHGFMPIVVKALSKEDYQAWLSEQKNQQISDASAVEQEWPLAELVERGEQIYQQSCATCHQADGQGIPNVFPAISGSTIASGPVDQHIDIVVNGGKQNPAMAAFGQQLTDVDIAAVITYQRNAWGNANVAGEAVQPATIKAYRDIK